MMWQNSHLIISTTMNAMSAKILTLEVTDNVELNQAEKRKRKEEKMLKKTSLSQIQMMKK